MPHEPTSEMTEREDAAALAALGFLSPKDLAAAPEDLTLALAEAAALLAETVVPVVPKPSVKSRLLDRVANFEVTKPLADVRPYDGAWAHSGFAGVDLKRLFTDPGSGLTTFLLRMEPGARLPSHRHGDNEQCLVVKGDVRWGELVYEEGDFVVMGKESTHPEITTLGGNLLLLVAGRSEFVHA